MTQLFPNLSIYSNHSKMIQNPNKEEWYKRALEIIENEEEGFGIGRSLVIPLIQDT